MFIYKATKNGNYAVGYLQRTYSSGALMGTRQCEYDQFFIVEEHDRRSDARTAVHYLNGGNK